MINKDTKVCISIAEWPGNFGATFHNMGYNVLNLNFIYIPRKVNAEQLEGAINSIKALNIVGCSVSMPHKVNIIQYLDSLDFSAKRIGAVNTVVRQDNSTLKGYNTDFYGAKSVLQKHSDIKGKKVLLIGAGGVAKAIGYAVKDLGGKLTITNRTDHKAKDLSKQLNTDFIHWDQLRNTDGHMLINATSVGMRDPYSTVVSKEIIDNFNIVKDVVIYPSKTRLLREAQKLGKQIISGTLMCVYQAGEQFKIYTGFETPPEVITKTLEEMEK